ncbi:MAG: DNAase, partial [Desulfobacterales bacterium]|nr:DNAase [Desulfobacterales bacterium]
MGLVDSHCHLNFEPMGDDIAGVIERAKASNVDYMLCVSVNLEGYPEILAIARAHKNIFASVG